MNNKSMLAIVIAARVTFNGIAVPSAAAQNRNPSIAESVTDPAAPTDPFDGRQIGENTVALNGNFTEKCDGTFRAGAIIDPSIPDWVNSGFTYKVKTPHQTGAPAYASDPVSMELQHYTGGAENSGNYGLYIRVPVGTDYNLTNAKLTITFPEDEHINPVVRDSIAPFFPVKENYSAAEMPVGTLEGDTITYNIGEFKTGTAFTAFVFIPFENMDAIKAIVAEGDPNFFNIDAVLEGDFAQGSYISCDSARYDDSYTAPGDEVRVNINGEDSIPDNTLFEVTTKPENTPAGEWTAEANPATGELRLIPPADTPPGIYDVVVTGTLPSGYKFEIPVRVHVDSDPNLDFPAAYDDSFTTPGQDVIVNLNGEAGVDERTVFSIDESSVPEGWTAEVDANTGRLTVTPPKDASQAVETINVIATIPGITSTEATEITIPARVHVQPNPEITVTVVTNDEGVEIGHNVTIINPDGTEQEFFVPNGKDGENGLPGKDGENGDSVFVVTQPGTNAEGQTGVTVITYIDNNDNDTLERGTDTILSDTFIADGKDGDSARIETTPGIKDGKDGIIVMSYLDLDDDGEYTEGIDTLLSEDFIPNGTDGISIGVDVTPGEKDGVSGNWVIVFEDTNNDGKLSEGEKELDREFIPNGADGADGSDGTDGSTPVIGDNGNWWSGGEDTGVKATCDCGSGAPGQDGKDGQDGTSITIVDTGSYDNGNVWVEFSDGTKIEIPAGKDGRDGQDGKDGQDAETDPSEFAQGGDGSAEGSSNINERCLPAALSVGLPLLLLLPIGLASQVRIPGMEGLTAQINGAFANVNTQIQQGLGIFNNDSAGAASGINASLGEAARVAGPIAGGLAITAAGALLIKYLVENCAPIAEGEEPGAFALPEGSSFGN